MDNLISPRIQQDIRAAIEQRDALRAPKLAATYEYLAAPEGSDEERLAHARMILAEEQIDAAARYLARLVKTYASVAGETAAADLLGIRPAGGRTVADQLAAFLAHEGGDADWITIPEAAELVGMSRQALHLLATNGRRGIVARRGALGWEVHRPSLAGVSVSETGRQNGHRAAAARLGRDLAEAGA